MAGSGKSTVCVELKRRGYESYPIEDIEGMFNIYHKGTRTFFEGYNNLNPDDIENAEWLCDTNKLQTLTSTQKSEVGFYCGVSSDIDELLPYFDKVLVLKANANTLNERLKSREGTDDIGNNQPGRDIIIKRKELWEKQLEEKGATVIDANNSLSKVVDDVLSKV